MFYVIPNLLNGNFNKSTVCSFLAECRQHGTSLFDLGICSVFPGYDNDDSHGSTEAESYTWHLQPKPTREGWVACRDVQYFATATYGETHLSHLSVHNVWVGILKGVLCFYTPGVGNIC